jgi:hypothetical protein
LLRRVDFAAARPVSEDYRGQFTACDGLAPGGAGRDTFRGVDLRLPDTPENRQVYLCSRDPSRVAALLTLADGGVYWDTKMALDVDGSWAAWAGIGGVTDLKMTSMRWRDVADKESQAAQVDPDRYPFVVMPTNGMRRLSGARSAELGAEFAATTGLKMGDMGVAIYRDRWTPVFIADGGPFMRLGEGSARVFEELGQTRCSEWNTERTRCVGTAQRQRDGDSPYIDSGLSRNVVFILYPGSARPELTSANAIATICTFAREKLGLTGSTMCPA